MKYIIRFWFLYEKVMTVLFPRQRLTIHRSFLPTIVWHQAIISMNKPNVPYSGVGRVTTYQLLETYKGKREQFAVEVTVD